MSRQALLHFNGTNGSTTITDEMGGTWTCNSVALQTSGALYGSASLNIEGGSENLSGPSYTLSGDFTIDITFKLDSYVVAVLWSLGDASGSSGAQINLGGDGWPGYVTSNAFQFLADDLANIGTAGVEHTIRLRRSGGVVSMAIDGVFSAHTFSDSNSKTGTFRLGHTASFAPDGLFDELLIHNDALGDGDDYTVSLPYASAGFSLTVDAGSFAITGTAAATRIAQMARPSGDIALGSWTDQAGGVTTIYTTIDEAMADTADYVKSPGLNAGESATYDFHLSDVTDPVSSADHIVSYKFRKSLISGSPQVDIVVSLRQGASTQIAANTHSDISTDWVEGSFTLSSGEADAITDYTDLRGRIVASVPGALLVAEQEESKRFGRRRVLKSSKLAKAA